MNVRLSGVTTKDRFKFRRRSPVTKVRTACVIPAALILCALAYGAPVRLRCESLQNPLGIDSTKPRLSWQSDNTERNWRQSAYQILVASSLEGLTSGHADIWDSG